jgi:hypothetical protein
MAAPQRLDQVKIISLLIPPAPAQSGWSGRTVPDPFAEKISNLLRAGALELDDMVGKRVLTPFLFHDHETAIVGSDAFGIDLPTRARSFTNDILLSLEEIHAELARELPQEIGGNLLIRFPVFRHSALLFLPERPSSAARRLA